VNASASKKKPPAGAAEKPAAKAVADKPATKAVADKPAAKPASAQPVGSAKAPAKSAVKPTPRAVAAPAPVPLAEPVRSGKASARLAQITVPSMAQSVAASSAKSAYVSTMPASTIAPMAPMGGPKDPRLADNWKNTPVEQLTDPEVLAMPDSEYMNDTQMAFFRLRLVQLKQDILNNAGETTEHLREDTVIVPDPADRATIEEEHALELRTRDRERKLLKKIEQSIARIDAGDYGYCDETGEPIGVGRLLARPTATLSLEAQQRRELKQKMFGD